MSCAHTASRPCARVCARPANARFGPGFPSSLALLWRSEKWAVALKGPAPVYTDTPTVTADGVAPGDGPSFDDVVVWADGGTRMVRFTASPASADITDDVEIGGGFWATSSGLEFRDGVNTATCATSWNEGDVVTAVVQVDGDVMRVGRVG